MPPNQLSDIEQGKSSSVSLRSIIKNLITAIPFGNAIVRRVLSFGFDHSSSYWEERYAQGKSSGAGSYGDLAKFKAEFLRDFMGENDIRRVIDFGCGDGNQIGYLPPVSYVGLDVSATAVDICRKKFANDPDKQFLQMEAQIRFADLSLHPAEMAMSLDVIYHLVEDDVFTAYLEDLFSAAARFVVIYSSNDDKIAESPHVRHRNITAFISTAFPDWTLAQHVKNPYEDASVSDFFVYKRDGTDTC